MKTCLLLLCGLCCALPGWAADLAFTLMPTAGSVTAGGPALVDLVAMNPGALDVPLVLPATVSGTLETAAGIHPVTLSAVALAPRSVAPGAFALRRYRLTLPPQAAGRVVLAVAVDGAAPVHAVFAVQPAAAPVPATALPSATPLGELAGALPVSSLLARTFAGRFMPNQPIYFLYGEGDQAAKFQFSFDYRLATVRWGEAGRQKISTLRLGYTQRSLWDIEAASSPFYDTSYLPEVAVVTDWPVPADGESWFTLMGLRGGFQHESNGRDGDDSRSLNKVYFRPRLIFGSLDSWFLVVLPEVHAYVGGLANNPRLKDYRGYGTLQLYVSRHNGVTLRFAGWAGESFAHPSCQLDLTFPVRVPGLNLEAYLQAQYFNGYGESLRAYDRKSDAVRVGLGLVR